MPQPKLLVADPGRGYLALKSEIDEAVAGVLASGWYILGPQVTAFEQEFAEYLGRGQAVAVASGTDALRLALLANDVGPGDEVITVANAGDPTPMAIWSIGATPVFVDVDANTGNMSVAAAKQAVNPRTKALLAVDLYGQTADLSALEQLAQEVKVPLIEDACQAHGAKYEGRKAGTFGAAGCFSFYPTKNLGALGDGGLVFSRDPDVAGRIRLLREYGWQTRNHSVIPGVNSRLDELQAAILRAKLPYLDGWVDRRRSIAARYDAVLRGLPGISTPVQAPHGRHAYHLYVIRLAGRAGLAEDLKARGICTGLHYPIPAYRQPSMEALLGQQPELPVTEALCSEVLSLPMFPEMADAEVDRVTETVCDYRNRRAS
mgnify:CR=1 FL=1